MKVQLHIWNTLSICLLVVGALVLVSARKPVAVAGTTASREPEGRVKIIVDANSDFDLWTENPAPADQTFMRENYHRMVTYSPYFDERLSWYPNAWEYEDAYAIYLGSDLEQMHPEWILQDASGNRLYIPFDCSNGICPQYAADIGNPDYQTHFIENLRERLSPGYRGLWLDDVNLADITVSNGNGDLVPPIDLRTGREMQLSDWRRYFAEFTEEIRAAFPEIEIAHNVHWWTSRSDPFVVRQLMSADWINLERGITDPGITGSGNQFSFTSFLEFIDWLHVRGKHIVMDDDDDAGIQQRDYELAFYLLINNGAGDMLGSDGDRSRIYPDQFWPGYTIDLGRAQGNHYRWRGLFRRDFECGMVLVNQPAARTTEVELDTDYLSHNGEVVNAVSLPHSSGIVLSSISCSPAQLRAPIAITILLLLGDEE